MTSSFRLRRLLMLAVAPLAAFMVYGCGGGGGGSGSSGSGGGASSTSSSSQSSYVAAAPASVSTRSGVFRSDPVVAGLSGGAYAVAWTERMATTGAPDTSGAAILYRVVSATGVAQTIELTANTTTAGDQEKPAVQALDNGGFVLAWIDKGATGTEAPVVRAQVFDATGAKVGTEIRVNSRALATPNLASAPDVRLANAGTGFMVAFRERAADRTDVTIVDEVRAQLFTANGAVVGSELVLKGFQTGFIGGQVPAFTLAGLTDGTFALSYEEVNNTLGLMQGKVQLYSTAGAATGSAIALNGGQEALQPGVMRLTSGRFAAVWAQSGAVQTMHSQAYSGGGTSYGAALTVNTNLSVHANPRGAVGLSDGRYVVFYAYNSGLNGQVVTPEGTKPFPEFEISSSNVIDTVSPGAGSNGFAVVWTEPNERNTERPVMLRIYTRQ